MAFKLFIINDEIIFDANSFELKSLHNVGEAVILNAPTSRCLQLLIEKKDEVVSRDNFLEQVWRTRGIVVSQNTFYQNISLLRKSLKNAGLTDDIIITVRRKGFSLAPHIRIQPLEDERITLCDSISSALVNEASMMPATRIPPITEAERSPIPRDSKTNIPGWLIFLLILVIVLEFISLILNWLNK